MITPPWVPPFTAETAARKVRMAENAWNSRDPERVSLAYSEDSQWRNRAEFFSGRAAIVEFLQRKWQTELDYRLIKELWAFTGDHIGVRFQYEWHDAAGDWYRSYGNELWEFDAAGLMRRRHASIHDIAIAERDRKFHWATPGSRPEGHPGLSELGIQRNGLRSLRGRWGLDLKGVLLDGARMRQAQDPLLFEPGTKTAYTSGNAIPGALVGPSASRQSHRALAQALPRTSETPHREGGGDP